MKVLTADEVRQADAHTIEHEPISSIDLMERAALACFDWIHENANGMPYIDTEGKGTVRVFCGTGNNGGDGLVIARQLKEYDYRIEVYAVRFSDKSSDDFKINEDRLKEVGLQLTDIKDEKDIPEINSDDFVIDAIFGSGLSRPIDGFSAQLVKRINESRARVLSIDIPSGLFSENNADNNRDAIIRANTTLTFQVAKLAFLLPENEMYVGDWHIIDIKLNEEFINSLPSKNYLNTKGTVQGILKHRTRFSHKGTYGHALILSGSTGKMGACVLASEATMRSGAGLVTAHIPASGVDILQTSVPEAMASIDGNDEVITELPKLDKYSAIGIGPGLGMDKQTANVLKLLIQAGQSLVIDADALNLLAENKTWLSFLPAGCILTPHPKEFERLVGETSDDYSRYELQKEFALKYNCYVVLKGANTAIACPDGDVFFNTTGNPGMATGGSGDVLTGILTGLLAQGYNSKEAALLGVFIHGVSGDFAAEALSQESMIAGDITAHLHHAFGFIRDESHPE